MKRAPVSRPVRLGAKHWLLAAMAILILWLVMPFVAALV